MAVYEELKTLGSRGDVRVNATFQDNLAARPAQRLELPRGLALPLRGRGRPRQLLLADARRARRPARELHARADVRREYDTRKTCAPYCTINCVQRVALFDNWRAPAEVGAGRADAAPRPRGRRDDAGARGLTMPAPRRAAARWSPERRSGIGEAFARAPARPRPPAGPGRAARRSPARAGGGAGRRRCEVVPADLAAPDGPERRCTTEVAGARPRRRPARQQRRRRPHRRASSEEPLGRGRGDARPQRARGGGPDPPVPARRWSCAGAASIVNVVSTSAFQPVPYLAVYGASKAFVLSFTEALAHRARGHGRVGAGPLPGPDRDRVPADVAGTDNVPLQPDRRR